MEGGKCEIQLRINPNKDLQAKFPDLQSNETQAVSFV